MSTTTLRVTTALLLAALAVAAGLDAPRAGAAVIASSVSGFEGGPALASDGRVVVGERRGDGALRISAIDPRTRARTDLASFGPLGDAGTYPELAITGSGAIVTATLDIYRQVGDTDAEQAQPTPLSTRLMTLLPSFVALGSCAPLQTAFAQLDAAGGDGLVATVGDECGTSRRAVRIRTASGTLTVPVTSGTGDASFPPDISGLRATGPVLTWVETRLDTGSPLKRTLVVARAATGQILLRAPADGSLLALGADGTAVLSAFPACALRVVSPASPAQRLLTLPAGLCPAPGDTARGQGAVALAGGRVAYATGGGYAVTDPGGGAHPLAEARIRGLTPSPVAFDGSTVYVTRVDCDADRLLAVDVAVAGPPLRPAPAATCPVRRSGPGRLRVGRDGRVSIGLRCAEGCRGTLRLVEQRRGRRERLAGRGEYLTSAGQKVVVRVGLARWARARAGCDGGLRVAAITHPVGPDHVSVRAGRGKGLGAYRLVSKARCRRSGGPAFTAPRPGPRP